MNRTNFKHPIAKAVFLISGFLLIMCSCNSDRTDSMIENMIVMEDQLQISNLMLEERGSSYWGDLNSDIKTTPNNEENKSRLKKLNEISVSMHNINDDAVQIIAEIEAIKVDLLKKSGENFWTENNEETHSILWRKYKKGEVIPARYNLSAVKDKANSSGVAEIFTDNGPTSPSGKGLQLWNDFINFRNQVVEHTGTYEAYGKHYSIHPISINHFSSYESLSKRVRSMISNSDCCHKEDGQALGDIYMNLTKQELVNSKGGKVHWIYKVFHGASVIEALSALTSMQQDILAARALATAHCRSKLLSCFDGFTSIMPLATGPSIAKAGDAVNIRVLMAGYDDYSLPTVTAQNKKDATIFYPKDGTGIVSFKAVPGLQTIRGTVSIKNNSGAVKTEKWEWTVNGVTP